MSGLVFEWDRRKSVANLRKHGVGFVEASTVFGDPLSLTIPDPDHSADEERIVMVGRQTSRLCWSSFTLLARGEFASSSLARPQSVRREVMKKAKTSSKNRQMRSEYDFSRGVRGKYVAQYRAGTNVVLLDPEVAKSFPDSKSVNDALRALVAIASRTKSRKRA